MKDLQRLNILKIDKLNVFHFISIFKPQIYLQKREL